LINFTIEIASIESLSQILEIQKRAFLPEAQAINDYTIEPLTQTLEELILDYKRLTILKATSSTGPLIGSVRGETIDDTTFISKLVVDPYFQGQGVGLELLKSIEKALPAKKYKLHTRNENFKALTLYYKLGYKVVSEKDFSPKLRFSFLEKSQFLQT
jgi:ribosomal protein S18 acetylase RimI-like enzyme